MRADAEFAQPVGRLDRGVGRHDDADVVSQEGQGLRQRPGDVGQAAGLGEGGDLGTQEKNLQTLHGVIRPVIGKPVIRDHPVPVVTLAARSASEGAISGQENPSLALRAARVTTGPDNYGQLPR